MTTNDISFPALCFNQGILEAVGDENTLTTTNKRALKPHGWYHGLVIVDAKGNAIRVKSARKIHGIGLFGGYNIFLNQRIKVELLYDGEPFMMSVDEVRSKVLNSFEKWHGWKTRGDFDELKASVEKAVSIEEIIRLVK